LWGSYGGGEEFNVLVGGGGGEGGGGVCWGVVKATQNLSLRYY